MRAIIVLNPVTFDFKRSTEQKNYIDYDFRMQWKEIPN
jgi:hypothetical protein